MPRIVQAATSSIVARTAGFQVVHADGITPSTDKAGEQPEIQVNFGGWVTTGIGILSGGDKGFYHALLDPSVIVLGNFIETRYQGVGTAVCPGDSFQVVGFDPNTRPNSGGVGSILVDHNYGGADNLRYITTEGAAVADGCVRAYLTSDYNSGNISSAFVAGDAITGSDGRWLTPMFLTPEDYTLFFYKPGVMAATRKSLTVT